MSVLCMRTKPSLQLDIYFKLYRTSDADVQCKLIPRNFISQTKKRLIHSRENGFYSFSDIKSHVISKRCITTAQVSFRNIFMNIKKCNTRLKKADL